MLAEIFMIRLEAMHRELTPTPTGGIFVPFDRASFGSFKDAKRKRLE